MAEIIGAENMRFAITGKFSGTTYGTGVSCGEAEAFVIANGFGERRDATAVRALERGQTWESHEDARGIRIKRTS